MEQCLTETEDDPGAKCAENLLNLGNMLLSEGGAPKKKHLKLVSAGGLIRIA